MKFEVMVLGGFGKCWEVLGVAGFGERGGRVR